MSSFFLFALSPFFLLFFFFFLAAIDDPPKRNNGLQAFPSRGTAGNNGARSAIRQHDEKKKGRRPAKPALTGENGIITSTIELVVLTSATLTRSQNRGAFPVHVESNQQPRVRAQHPLFSLSLSLSLLFFSFREALSDIIPANPSRPRRTDPS